MAKTVSYSYKDAEEKSKKFLKDVLGKELFDKFFKEGKIEVKSGGNVYELHNSGRIVNKSTNQTYCIIPNRPDYPIYDVIAIKYAWLKYGLKTVEKVANKTSLAYRPRDITEARRTDGIGYDAFVHYMENTGWAREQITIDEYHTNIISTYSIGLGTTGRIIDIRCPLGCSMTTMGLAQIPEGTDRNTAYTYSLYITDKNGNEISGHNRIRIEKIKPSEEVIQLARSFYSEFSITRSNENKEKTKDELYRWRNGIMLYGGEYIRTEIINSNTDISYENIKIKADFDLWLKRY